MQTKGVLKGNKLNKRHSTYLPLAGDCILRLKAEPLVRKIVLGVISPCRSGVRRVTAREDHGQTRVNVRDVNAIQVLYVIGMDPEAVMRVLKDVV